MAKKQSFEDKSKAKAKAAGLNVKFVKAIKGDNGKYKFQEKFVKIEDINKVTDLK